jgi:hypothetical protein
MLLPAVPRPGDAVRVFSGCEPCEVRDVEWIFDPNDDEQNVLVFLTDLNSDEFVSMTEVASSLLEDGWRPELGM